MIGAASPAAAVLIASACAVPTLAVSLAMASLVMGPNATSPGDGPVPDIPSNYLAFYRVAADRFVLGSDGWTFLAAVGKVECDHGRSTAVGCDRGESNSAGAQGPAQFLPPTWAAYGVDANGDGVRDVYEPADAIFGMARYLRASGAPGDWRRALYAYNHDWSYVERVLALAAQYRGAAQGQGVLRPADNGAWLVDLPGHPGERCDRRIVADVIALVRTYAIRVTDCFGGAPHALNGEHPLGLAADAVPADGRWTNTLRLARDFGWSPACARTGCPDKGPFRAILYNGFPNHGDPAHAPSPHLHLSWQHGPAAPFTRAPWVRTLLPASASRVDRTCSRSAGPEGGHQRGPQSRPSGAGGECRE